MAVSLLKQQQSFSRMVPLLLSKAFELGYEVTLGDAYRDPRVHGKVGEQKSYSHPNSFHKVRLAIDINLFTKDGEYLTGTEGHDKLGEYWESIGGTWGGRFRDPNHYSLGEGT